MPPFFTQPCIFKRPQLFLLCVAPLKVEVNAEEFLQVWQGVAGQNQPNFCAVMWPFFPPEEGWIQQGTSWLSGTERPSKTCFLSGQVVSGYLDAAHTPQVHPWSWMLHHASTWNSSNQTIDKKTGNCAAARPSIVFHPCVDHKTSFWVFAALAIVETSSQGKTRSLQILWRFGPRTELKSGTAGRANSPYDPVSILPTALHTSVLRLDSELLKLAPKKAMTSS